MGDSKIACVIPTIRPEMHAHFVEAWKHLFDKHNVTPVTVWDGDEPYVECGEDSHWVNDEKKFNKLVSNRCAAVRNLGFSFVAERLPNIEYIITLDDDEEPIGDPIQDHIDALNMRVPISWFPTTLIEKPTDYMRGFPYGVRTEAQVMISHGVWHNNLDYDAPTQLLKTTDPAFYKGPIPKGVFFPFCGMNVAFRREVLPYIYYAPVGQFKGAERFDDIFGGLEIKKDMDRLGHAIVSGYATTNHTRASNVFKNLEHESVGIRKNEEYWKGEYDEWYVDFLAKRAAWYAYHS